MTAALIEPAEVHAARSHGDKHSRELVEAWDEVTEKLTRVEGVLTAIYAGQRLRPSLSRTTEEAIAWQAHDTLIELFEAALNV